MKLTHKFAKMTPENDRKTRTWSTAGNIPTQCRQPSS
jgi:hypothetical protein